MEIDTSGIDKLMQEWSEQDADAQVIPTDPKLKERMAARIAQEMRDTEASINQPINTDGIDKMLQEWQAHDDERTK